MQILGSVSFSQILPYANFPEAINVFYFCHVLDDDSIMISYCNGNYGSNTCFALLIVDKTGNYTWYSSPKLGAGGAKITSLIPLGQGRFLIDVALIQGGGSWSYFLTPQNLKLNNKVPILLLNSSFSLSISCYNSPSFFAYDGVQSLLGIASYDPVGQFGGPCYSSTYKVNYGVLKQIGGGFVGNYVSGTSNNYDPYNQTAASFPGTIVSNTNRNQSNGISTLLGYNAASQYFIGRNTYTVHPGIGITDCVTSNGSYVSSKAYLSYFQNNGYNEYNNNFDSNVPGIVGGANGYGSPTGGHAIQLFDLNNNIADVLYTGAANLIWTTLSNHGFFMLDSGKNVDFAPFSPSIYFQPFVNRTPHPLANFSHSAQNVFFRS